MSHSTRTAMNTDTFSQSAATFISKLLELIDRLKAEKEQLQKETQEWEQARAEIPTGKVR